MLRPEKMSKVSVAGSKAVMRDTIEAIHDLNLVHLSDYGGQWEGFDNGDPIEGADDASDKLVTVRSIESILDVDPEDAGPSRIITEGALEEELEDVRVQVNELDDRRNELEDELRDTEERLDSLRPFADLGIDLDLLSGYDTIEVRVGEGDENDVREALEATDAVDEFELFTGDRTTGVFARADPAELDEALVSADFTTFEIPDAEGSPESYTDELRHEKQKIESKLDGVRSELEDLEIETAGFLLAAEETLAIDVQKAEAPLQFATTEHAFVAEGWIPTERYDDLTSTLQRTVGDRVSVEELERASYHEHEGGHAPQETETESTNRGEVATDGGHAHRKEQPPVVQDNPGPAKPFELLVETINRPRYFELDPTVILFLTFPVFFGFMIGDVGYGALYTLIGYALYTRMDSDAVRSLGGIAVWAGLFTMLFGIFYGEIFGFHVLGEIIWVEGLGMSGPPIKKGFSPATLEYARAWLVLSLAVGILHLALGWAFDFHKKLDHGLWEAITEAGSWLIMLFAWWWFVFSDLWRGAKPEFIYQVLNGEPFSLGFSGVPAFILFEIPVPVIGSWPVTVSGLLFLGGLALLYMGDPIEVVEFLNVFVNVLSYTRLAAVLLAKAVMAFVVNLLVVGAYQHHGEFHFMWDTTPQHVINEYGREAIMFSGLIHSGIAGVLVGLVILVVGHLLVLVLGITSAGLQAVRLEYVEFFGKFYDGGGEKYEPFGYDRAYTTED